ncbi:MAG: M23 family metallopeptidase [Bacteroidaceae bacterium]|nr:M23 family metallopeptidase [Bacteroidaceae bacterium]
MVKSFKKYISYICLALLPLALYAQGGVSTFGVPFDFPLVLSGNFGELRSNHFHSGVDFKTQGAVGKPIRCVADGYICRASVQPGGYGNALYVMHDNGYMTVYGHLERFPKNIAERVRKYQYDNETFRADLRFAPGEYKVRRGDVFAFAGNSGYSFGPHLHFEVRDSSGEELYDPMRFYATRLNDTIAPRASSFAVYPRAGKGVLACGHESKVYKVVEGMVKDTIMAWGQVGFGVKALDYMNGTNNKYGVRRIELYADDSLLFSSTMDNFSFAETRLINAWVDYGRYINDGEWFQRLHVLENNTLRAIDASVSDGWLNVDEERYYNIECRLSDYHGNTTVYRMSVLGKKDDIRNDSSHTHELYCFKENQIDYMGMRLFVPNGELFANARLNVRIEEGSSVSPRYSLGGEEYPVWHGADLQIKVDDAKGVDTSKLYIRRVTKKGGHSVGGKFRDGWVEANITILGTYEVAADTVAPRLKPVNENVWEKNGRVVIAMSDRETSVSSFKGTLNGSFVLFKYSSKNGRLTLDLKEENIRRGVHQLKVVAVDAHGNEAVYEKEIKY